MQDDPLKILGIDWKTMNETQRDAYIQKRQRTGKMLHGPTHVFSRRVGNVHRYLGYIPISEVWTGHPYFDNIPTTSPECAYSRSYNCHDPVYLAGTRTETLADGSVVKTTISADGTVSSVKSSPDGTVIIQTKNPDGSITEKTVSPDGTTTIATKNPDGSTTVSVTSPDGSVSTQTVSANGSITVEKINADGTKTAEIKNADGSTTYKVINLDGSVSVEEVAADGTKTVTVITSDGKAITTTTDPCGKTTVAYANANGTAINATDFEKNATVWDPSQFKYDPNVKIGGGMPPVEVDSPFSFNFGAGGFDGFSSDGGAEDYVMTTVKVCPPNFPNCNDEEPPEEQPDPTPVPMRFEAYKLGDRSGVTTDEKEQNKGDKGIKDPAVAQNDEITDTVGGVSNTHYENDE